jgi:hypothetical protein
MQTSKRSIRVLGLRGKHQNRFDLKDRMEINYTGQYTTWGVLIRLGHMPTWRSYLLTSILSKSNRVTQSQLTTQGQSFEANLASLEAMVEQVFNSDQAMGSWKEFSKKGVRLW